MGKAYGGKPSRPMRNYPPPPSKGGRGSGSRGSKPPCAVALLMMLGAVAAWTATAAEAVRVVL